jgi:hypothetical protein
MSNPSHHATDAGALVLIGASFAGYLPVIASLLAIVWYAIEIWESETGAFWRRFWTNLFTRSFKHDRSDAPPTKPPGPLGG